MTQRIALLSPRLDSGDAVGSDVLGMAAALRSVGADVRLFAEGWTVSEPVCHVRQIRSFLRSESDILIYHYSIAWPRALELFRTLRCRKILRYHNITPPEFFEPYHAGIANNCRAGLAMLPEFIGLDPDLILTPSLFNRSDLLRTGAADAKTFALPCFHRAQELLTQPANHYSLTRGESADFTILTVGRIVPNKGYDDLFEETADLLSAQKKKLRVVCVGRKIPGMSRYNRYLNVKLESSRLKKAVKFTGPVSQSILKSWYLKADVLVSTSRHEGFCVPLVEAMALRVPIVARPYAAVPETLGAGGTAVGKDRGEISKGVDRLMNPGERALVLDAAYREYRARFEPGKIASDFVGLMKPLLHREVP